MTNESTPFDLRELDAIDHEDDGAEAALDDFLDRMQAAFCVSDEGKDLAVRRGESEIGWDAVRMTEIGWNHIGTTPLTMSVGELDEILTEIFPRKLTLENPADAERIIPELRAFWQWAGRVHGVTSATAMAELLDEIEAEFPSIMNDRSRFGPAKAFVTAGLEAGYDMSDRAQSNEFMHVYNAALALQHIGLPAAPTLRAAPTLLRAAQKKSDAKAKQKRTMEKASRKRNRRK